MAISAKSKVIILRAMKNARGDDYERALRAFGGLSPDKLITMPWGHKRTVQQYLDECKKEHDDWEQASNELTSLLE